MDRHTLSAYLVPVEAALAKIAARQHGLLTRPQVRRLGVSDTMIERRVITGRWVRVSAGVYRLAGYPSHGGSGRWPAASTAGPAP